MRRLKVLLSLGHWSERLAVPKRADMKGTEAQCTVPGGNVVSGMVVQVVACDGEEYHAVAIEGATPLLPLSWLLLLAGWKYLPKVDQGRIRVSVQSPEGVETELTERSKMHYLDQDTFWGVLSDVWKRNGFSSGMTSDQLKVALSAREASRAVNAVTLARPASIRFLDMKGGRRVYMKRVIDLQQAIQKMVWPYQNNRTSIAGGSRALFLGAQTNRGLQNGCVVRRTFQERYKEVLLKVHALAPELLARYDRFNAAKKSKGKGSFETHMLLLNAVERADSKCYCFWILELMLWFSEKGRHEGH